MNHSALCYFERFGLLHGLSDEQEQRVEQQTRMLNVRRGQPVYLPADRLLGQSGPARLAHRLLDLSQQYVVRDGQGVLIPLRLPPGDLAKPVGLTRRR